MSITGDMMSNVGIRTDLFTGRPFSEVSVWDFFSSVKQTHVVETPRFINATEGTQQPGAASQEAAVPTRGTAKTRAREVFASSSQQVERTLHAHFAPERVACVVLL